MPSRHERKPEGPIPWRRIRALKWTPTLWTQAVAYLQDDTVPASKSASGVSRFKRNLKWFTLGYTMGEPQSGNSSSSKTTATATATRATATTTPTAHILLLDLERSRTYRVVPEDQVQQVLAHAWSDVKTNAFRGVNSFYERLSRETIGVTKQAVRAFVKRQEVQQRSLRATNTMSGLQTRVVKPLRPTHPFQWFQIDLIDVSALSNSNDKATFLLTVLDIFSKFLYVRRLKNKTGALIADTLQDVFLADGAPQILQSDNGPEFRNEHMDTLCERWEIKQRHGRPYKPSTQGAVERVNQTIKQAIEKYLLQQGAGAKRYIDVLHFLVFSYNTTQHSTTKYTPFEVHKGRDATLSALLTAVESNGDAEDESNVEETQQKPAPIDDMRDFKRVQDVKSSERTELVRERISKHADKMIERSRSRPAWTTPINVGDYVRIDTAASGQRPSAPGNKRKGPKWSKEVYTVTRVLVTRSESKSSRHSEPEYELDKAPKQRYFGHELQPVEARSSQEKSERKEPEDLHFGARFNSEQHIRGLAKRPIVPAAEGPADQDEQIGLEPREPRPARNRKGVTRFIQIYY